MPTHPKNIYIIGAQCTGKTTLANALADRLRNPANRSWHGITVAEPTLIKEVARHVLERHNFTAFDIVSSRDRAFRLQQLIFQAQDCAETGIENGVDAKRETETITTSQDRNEHLQNGSHRQWFISDRSGIDPLVYARAYAGEGAVSKLLSCEAEAWTRLCGNLRAGLVFVCEAGADWLLDDGVRLMPKDNTEWIGLHRLFCEILDELGIAFVVVGKDIVDVEERVDLVLRTWRD